MRVCDRCLNIVRGQNKYCSKCGHYVGLKFCTKCGTPLNENARFCDVCGALQQDRTQPQMYPCLNNRQPMRQQAIYPQKVRNEISHFIPLLIWSIILVLALNPVGMGFGIASIVYLLKAKDYSNEPGSVNSPDSLKEKKENVHIRILKSRILCISATIIDIISILVLIILIASL